MALPGRSSSSDLPVFTVTKNVFNALTEGTNFNLAEFEEYTKENMKPASQALTGKSVSFKTSVQSEIVKVRNVVGIIEGRKKDEYIVVGGHYDHLGKYDGWIWNGADDNASGTVGVMTIAKNQASMQYTAACPGIRELTEKNIKEYDINLDIRYRASAQPRGGSDHAPFAEKDIPIFYFMAAMHPDYHQPSDELSKVNWEKTTNTIRAGWYFYSFNCSSMVMVLCPSSVFRWI